MKPLRGSRAVRPVGGVVYRGCGVQGCGVQGCGIQGAIGPIM